MLLDGKAKIVTVEKRWTDIMYGKTLTKQTGERGKKPHQPTNNNHRVTKTWADVIKNGGINVKIVLGNSNLRQAITRDGHKKGVNGVTGPTP
jgi:hypothetical protein